tara:strand:- start:14667 stop:15479 length:813 start_codon:yes stop_codon:yes gene_type:complete
VISKIINLSIVLPTINESENLEILIPNLISSMKKIDLDDYELLIVDDGSTDNTVELINNINKENNKVKIIERNKQPSLPLSIWEGIENSTKEFVMWLDADGSMPPLAVESLINKINNNQNSIVIGSRFVEGGGYKGVKEISNNSLFKAMSNVRDSNDSVLGMVVSNLFNKLLITLLNLGVKDITSGFIVGKKDKFTLDSFKRASYGDYFIYLVNDLIKNNDQIIEVGYICETRVAGVSKTASNLLQLIRRGIPYLKAAVVCRIDKYGNKR